MAGTRAPTTGDDGQPASDAVLDAIAAEKEIEPLALDVPLYEAIDPDALDALVGDERFDGTVTFDYLGQRVRVHGDGRVELGAADE